jgi:hypothetical protein
VEDDLEFKRERLVNNPPKIPEFNCVPQHSLEDEADPKKNRKAIFASDHHHDKYEPK